MFKSFCRVKPAQQVLTYFLSAPPLRKTGYVEREFDDFANQILELGFEVEKCILAPHPHGLWIQWIIRPTSQNIDWEKFKRLRIQGPGSPEGVENFDFSS